MKKFNICIILPKLYPCDIGGLEIFYYHFIHELKNNYNIWLFTKCPNWKKNKHDNVNITYSNENKFINPTINLYLGIFLSLFKLRNELDIIIIPYTSNSSLIYPLLVFYFLFKIPYVISVHGGGLYK